MPPVESIASESIIKQEFGCDLNKLSIAKISLSPKDSSEDIQVMKNLGAILQAAGSDFEKAVKTTCFLADMNDFAQFNEVYAKYFTGKPGRSCVAVKTLPKGVLVEVEVVAVLG